MLFNQPMPLPIFRLHRDSISCSCKTVDMLLELSSFLHFRQRLWSLMNRGEYPSTFEFYRPRHLLLWLDSYIMRLSQCEKITKLMDKLTPSSGNIERMIPVWQFFRSEWRTQFPIDFVGSLELDKPGGVMDAASPLGNVVLPMNGKQSILVRSHI